MRNLSITKVFYNSMLYTDVSIEDCAEWVTLALALWPYETAQDMQDLFLKRIPSNKDKTILCRDDNSEVIAFIDLSIREEYVEGSSSSPVGYVEGIYVKPEYRKQGIARELLRLGEEWSRAHGCTEYASDTEIENVESQAFHLRAGFEEAHTIVHFIKRIR
jgi:aminoglycoside 6'-N-acetyltransferase I